MNRPVASNQVTIRAPRPGPWLVVSRVARQWLCGAIVALGTLGAKGDQATTPSPGVSKQPLADSSTGPRIHFAEPVYDFGRVEAGQVIAHDFALSNVGDQPLVIQDVRPSCGCTTTTRNWGREIAPGKSSIIPIHLNTKGFSGITTKTIVVVCNDSTRSNVTLQVKADIWKPVEVIPALAMFNVAVGSQIAETRTVRIVNNTEQPLSLSEPVCTNSAFHAILETIKPGKEFDLKITFTPGNDIGAVSTPVTLKTSRANLPVLTVSAYATVRPAVSVTPAQAILPPGPLASTAKLSFTIQNYDTNALILSEPEVTSTGAEAKVEELQPGRIFRLSLNFPPDFKLEPGRTVEARVKTNHPRFPLLTIPIRQGQTLAAIRQPVPIEPATAGAPERNQTGP